MKDNKQLPTIKDIKVAITLKKVTIQDVIKGFENMLLAHKQHAKEMLKFDKKGDVIDDAFYYVYWRGRLEALQALKGEVKK